MLEWHNDGGDVQGQYITRSWLSSSVPILDDSPIALWNADEGRMVIPMRHLDYMVMAVPCFATRVEDRPCVGIIVPVCDALQF